MVQAKATGKYVRTSAQKAGLVLAQIRGRDIGHALATLKFAKKSVAHDIEKVLRSAIANAQNQSTDVDVDKLVVAEAYVNEGPRTKRVRPAPQGRAFRYQRRSSHIAVTVTEPVLPAVTEAGVPETAKVAAAAGLTVIPALVPVIVAVTVSVAVRVREPTVFSVYAFEKVWTPASPAPRPRSWS